MEYKITGLKELQSAVERNPKVVLKEVGKFITRGLAVLVSTINNNPWRMGMAGGGVPVKTGNLRDTHIINKTPWEGRIKPTAGYAQAVHKKRPWLDYAVQANEKRIELLEKDMLATITEDLAK